MPLYRDTVNHLFFYHPYLKRVQTGKVILHQFNTIYPFLHMHQKAAIHLQRDKRKFKKKTFFVIHCAPSPPTREDFDHNWIRVSLCCFTR